MSTSRKLPLDTVTTAMAALVTGTPDLVAKASDAELLASLKQIYQGLLQTDFATYDMVAVHAAAPQLLQLFFDLRLQLRSLIPTWAAGGLMSLAVQGALRDVFRASRYAGEMLGELHLGHPRLKDGETVAAGFTGPAGFVQLNKAFGPGAITFQPGDLIMQRGRMHNSAAIARIGDVDSQFSHVAMVATGSDGELVIVEALIEEGSIINSVEKALAHGLGRAVLFRHRNAELAKLASELIHDHVRRTNADGNHRILYDFTMELDIYHLLFCSKLVRLAFAMASSGAYMLPTYPTQIDMKNRDFLDRIGVSASRTFAPGDLELETDFDVVAEWCDYRVTSELRLKDMVMTKLFAWMEEDGYRFEPNLNIDMVALLGRFSTHLPVAVQDLVASVVAKVPPNMSSATIGAVAMLHKTAEPLYLELLQLESQAIADTGYQLHPRQIFDALERIKAREGNTIGYLAIS
jgi:hypothetical protein